MHLAEYVPLKARVKVHLAPELDDAELEKAEVVGLGSWTPGWWKELSPIPPEVKWARQYWVPLDKDAEDVRNVAVYVPSRVGVTKLTSKLFRTSFDAYLALHETLSQESWRHLRTIGLEGFSSCDYHLLELGAIIAAYLPTPFGDVATPLREELYRVIELRKAGHWVTGCLLQHAAKVAEGGTDLQGAFVQRLVDFCINTLGYTPVAGAKPLCLRTVEVLRPECVDRPALSKMPVERRRELLMEQLAAVDRYTNEFEAIKINARQFQAMTKNPVAWTRTPDSQTPSPVSWTRTEEVPAKKQKPLPLDDSDRADVEAMVEQIFRDNQSSLASCLDQCLDQCLTQTTNSPEWISNALGSLDITETGEIADSDWTDVLGSLDITEIEAELAGGDQHITPHTSPLINENGDFLDEILASIEQNGERLCAP
ncbi:hypothetical protein GNI_045720 [Gregarina niphandrodes]|uniref:Uncharacterized protein n=1 Tax=Gregarina niphandrodes TaxID=110365 RepID=A0A023B9U6_GRENI|nr:hypothetical protein GNI_045720 [Gregarina niphandrodes]EZG76062.1 hypothetical protein GNI_045720 [Gregarina niphandrodes]|eukprot:XP_011129596.1 hypothetical protein GNI_045720 [Gregarina niphandrodes]